MNSHVKPPPTHTAADWEEKDSRHVLGRSIRFVISQLSVLGDIGFPLVRPFYKEHNLFLFRGFVCQLPVSLPWCLYRPSYHPRQHEMPRISRKTHQTLSPARTTKRTGRRSMAPFTIPVPRTNSLVWTSKRSRRHRLPTLPEL